MFVSDVESEKQLIVQQVADQLRETTRQAVHLYQQVCHTFFFFFGFSFFFLRKLDINSDWHWSPTPAKMFLFFSQLLSGVSVNLLWLLILDQLSSKISLLHVPALFCSFFPVVHPFTWGGAAAYADVNHPKGSVWFCSLRAADGVTQSQQRSFRWTGGQRVTVSPGEILWAAGSDDQGETEPVLMH